MSPRKVCPNCCAYQQNAVKTCAECGHEFYADRVTPRLTMTLTVREWRLLAIAARKVKESAFIHLEDAKAVRELARRITTETGKHE